MEKVQERDNEMTVPYIAYESTQARNERTIKRLIIALLIAVALIFASNMIWLYEWTRYDYVDTDTKDIDIDGESGTANYIGGEGNIINGQNNNTTNENTFKNEE